MELLPTKFEHSTRYYVILTAVFVAMLFGGGTYIIEELRMQQLHRYYNAQLAQNEAKIMEVYAGCK